MKKYFIALILWIGIIATIAEISAVRASAFSTPEIFFDGQSGDQIYVPIMLENVTDIRESDGSFCQNTVECPLWTAMLWDGSDPSTISYAGATYNTSDELSQSMTFTISPSVFYNTLEIIGMNENSEPVARGKIMTSDFLPPSFLSVIDIIDDGVSDVQAQIEKAEALSENLSPVIEQTSEDNSSLIPPAEMGESAPDPSQIPVDEIPATETVENIPPETSETSGTGEEVMATPSSSDEFDGIIIPSAPEEENPVSTTENSSTTDIIAY